MSGNVKKQAQERDYDTTYRASSLDTHPTHLCMPVFRRFLRVRSGCVLRVPLATSAFLRLCEGAIRTIAGARS